MKTLALLLLAALSVPSIYAQQQPATAAGTFTNPLLPSGADPSVVQEDGYYYYMNTTGRNLTIWRTRDITDLQNAEKKVVWTPPASGPYSKEIWAPELHRVEGKWYIYFAADAGTNDTHRVWVLENSSANPLQGAWTMRGKLADPSDKWAIDPSEFDNAGQHYVIWSGWAGDTNGTQSIFIARLANPWTIDGHRTLISSPDFAWEKVGDLNKGDTRYDPTPHIDVNEGPEILQHGGKIFLIYSASACWTNYYELGMLTADAGSNLLDPRSWTKSTSAVFWEDPQASVFGPGHNTFFQSPDGKEDWILYHANAASGQGCSNFRSPRAQRFTWNPDGTPNFGRPLPTSQPLQKPSGTR